MKSSHEALIIRMKGDDIEEVTDQVASEIGFTLSSFLLFFYYQPK